MLLTLSNQLSCIDDLILTLLRHHSLTMHTESGNDHVIDGFYRWTDIKFAWPSVLEPLAVSQTGGIRRRIRKRRS